LINPAPFPAQAVAGLEWVRSLRVTAAIMVIAGSLVQIFVAVFIAPKFAATFEDVGGGQPLPWFTKVVLSDRWMFVGLAGALPFAALFLVRCKASPVYLFALVAALVLAIGLTTVGLCMGLSTGGDIIRQR